MSIEGGEIRNNNGIAKDIVGDYYKNCTPANHQTLFVKIVKELVRLKMAKSNRCDDCGHFECICGQPINVPTITTNGSVEKIAELTAHISLLVEGLRNLYTIASALDQFKFDVYGQVKDGIDIDWVMNNAPCSYGDLSEYRKLLSSPPISQHIETREAEKKVVEKAMVWNNCLHATPYNDEIYHRVEDDLVESLLNSPPISHHIEIREAEKKVVEAAKGIRILSSPGGIPFIGHRELEEALSNLQSKQNSQGKIYEKK